MWLIVVLAGIVDLILAIINEQYRDPVRILSFVVLIPVALWGVISEEPISNPIIRNIVWVIGLGYLLAVLFIEMLIGSENLAGWLRFLY